MVTSKAAATIHTMTMILSENMDVSKNRGTPKWMVKIMEHPIEIGWYGGKPTIFGNSHNGGDEWDRSSEQKRTKKEWGGDVSSKRSW